MFWKEPFCQKSVWCSHAYGTKSTCVLTLYNVFVICRLHSFGQLIHQLIFYYKNLATLVISMFKFIKEFLDKTFKKTNFRFHKTLQAFLIVTS